MCTVNVYYPLGKEGVSFIEINKNLSIFGLTIGVSIWGLGCLSYLGSGDELFQYMQSILDKRPDPTASPE
jgi:hypothetical protein